MKENISKETTKYSCGEIEHAECIQVRGYCKPKSRFNNLNKVTTISLLVYLPCCYLHSTAYFPTAEAFIPEKQIHFFSDVFLQENSSWH